MGLPRGVIDEEAVRLVEQVSCLNQLRPIRILQLTVVNLGQVYFANRGNHPVDQGDTGHLKGVDDHHLVGLEHCIFNDVHREGGFAH